MSWKVALPAPSNTTASFAPTLADASQNLAPAQDDALPRLRDYSQDRQPSGGFPELEPALRNAPTKEYQAASKEVPPPSGPDAHVSQDEVEEAEEPLTSNAPSPMPKEAKPLPDEADHMEHSVEADTQNLKEQTTQKPAPVPEPPSREAAKPTECKVPLLSDKSYPAPPRNQLSLSRSAIDKRMRRVFTPKASGEFKVSERFVAEWKKGGQHRLGLEKVMAACGYDPDPSLNCSVCIACFVQYGI